MSRRNGSSDATFYFQAWRVDKVVGGESWSQNKELADFVEQHLSADAKKWLFVRACVPTKERPGLLIPYSICVKQRAAKIGQNPADADRSLLQFRDKEYPAIARSYFRTRLMKSLDFFNAYADGVESESPLANFEVVKSSTQLKERIQSAIRYAKRESWGDVVHGLVENSSGSDFKAARFISKRSQDPKANPHVLPTVPLRSPLLLCNGQSSDSLISTTATELPGSDSTSIDGSSSDATSECSSSDETSRSSVAEESSEVCSTEDATECYDTKESSQSSDFEQSGQSHVAAEYDGTVVRSSSKAVAPRQKMSYVMSQDAQTAVLVLQNAGSWLQYLMASRGNAGPQFEFNYNTPIIIAAAVSPLQALRPDGTMRVFFMSQARRILKDDSNSDDKDRRVSLRRKGKAVREWVIGSAKVSTRALTKKLRKNLQQRNEPVESVVGPNNRVIEMTPAPDIPEAIIVTPTPEAQIQEGDIIQHEEDEDGFVRVDTTPIKRVVEIVDEIEKKGQKRPVRKTRRSAASSGFVAEKKRIEASDFPQKPAKAYTHPFARKSWRDEEPQAPQLICDNFLHVEDVQVFSFSAFGHTQDLMHGGGYLGTPPDDNDGIKVWSPPVVGIFSWVWDHMSVGGWSKTTAH